MCGRGVDVMSMKYKGGISVFACFNIMFLLSCLNFNIYIFFSFINSRNYCTFRVVPLHKRTVPFSIKKYVVCMKKLLRKSTLHSSVCVYQQTPTGGMKKMCNKF